MKSTYTHFVCVWTNERDERSEREPDDDIGSCCGSKVCKHAANIKAINPQLEKIKSTKSFGFHQNQCPQLQKRLLEVKIS